jgi:hypothetical protein
MVTKIDSDTSLTVDKQFTKPLSKNTFKREGPWFYVEGDFSEDRGVEFRHFNRSQGVGFGYNTIYATGSKDDQDLNLKARGKGKVQVQGDLNVQGKVTASEVVTGAVFLMTNNTATEIEKCTNHFGTGQCDLKKPCAAGTDVTIWSGYFLEFGTNASHARSVLCVSK